MPRFITSSATSRLVQWLMGRPDSSGFSQANCWIWHTWSAVIRTGFPGRGSSSSRSSMLKSDRSIGCKSTHLCRHWRTISRESFCSRTIWLLLLPSLAANTIRALLAICWRTLRRLIKWHRPAFSLSVSMTATALGPGILVPHWLDFGPVAYLLIFDCQICRRIYASLH